MLLIGEFMQSFQCTHTHTGIIVIDKCVNQRLFDRLICRLLRQGLDSLQSRSRIVRIAKGTEQQVADSIVSHLPLEAKRLGDFAGQFDLPRYGIGIHYLKIGNRSISGNTGDLILSWSASDLRSDRALIADVYAEGE